MSTRTQRFIDLLAMGRVANVPTVLCNVFVGCLLGAIMWKGQHSFLPDDSLNPSLILPLLSGACLYLGGCFLNDWSDSNWDRKHRPERAIPSGRIEPKTVLKIAAAFLAAGLAFAFAARMWALIPAAGIFAAILVYTLYHKQSPLSIIPMGLCRGLLYSLGFVSQAIPESMFEIGPFSKTLPFWSFLPDIALILVSLSLGLLAYIAGLSLAARFESRGQLIGNAKFLALCLLFAPILTHTWFWIILGPSPYSYIGAIIFWILLLPVVTYVRTRGVGPFVSALLAVIPLVDFIVLVPLSQYIGNFSTISPATILAVPFIAIISAFALQRLAPAT